MGVMKWLDGVAVTCNNSIVGLWDNLHFGVGGMVMGVGERVEEKDSEYIYIVYSCARYMYHVYYRVVI